MVFRKNIGTVIAALSLGILGAGCGEEKEPAPAVKTNASSITEEAPPLKIESYTLGQVQIKDKHYRAIPLQDHQTAEIAGKTIKREFLGNVFLFPYDNHTIQREGNKITLIPPEEKYFLVSIKKEGDKIVLNEGPALVKKFVTLDRNNLEHKVDEGTEGPGQMHYTKGKELSAPRIIFQGVAYRVFPADHVKIEDIDYLPQVFVAEKEMQLESRTTIIDGKEETKTGLRGYLYIPVKGKFSPSTTSAPSATIDD